MKVVHYKFQTDLAIFVPTCGIWGERFHAEISPPVITDDLDKVTCRLCLRRMGKIRFPMGAQAHKIRRRAPKTLVACVTAAISKAEVKVLIQGYTPPFLRAKMAIAAVRRWDKMHRKNRSTSPQRFFEEAA